MAYGDYIPAATMQDTCDADTGDTPGKAADCKFIGQTEAATTATANRAHLALAQNADELKAILDSQKALTQLAELLTFSGSSIVINPDGTGGGGVHIDYGTAGYLYVGNGSYSGTGQEGLDTLFQFLDEEHNEVMFDGEEVKVTAIAAGATLGGGFVNGGTVTLTLGTDSSPGGVSVPSGDYRLKYARETTLATAPDDFLITAELRGAQEGSGENQKPMWAVCAPAGGRGDYSGVDAFADAVANGEERIYLKAGTYGPLTADTALTAVKYIMGEHVDAVTIQINGNYNMTDMPSAEGFSVEVTSAASDNNHVTLAEGAIVRNVKFKSLKLFLNSNVVVDNILCGGYWGAFEVPDNSYNVRGSNILYDGTDYTADHFFDIRQGCRNLSFDNIRPLVVGSNIPNVFAPLLWFGGTTASVGVKFSNCYFETEGNQVLSTGNDVEDALFENCFFYGNDSQTSVVSISGAQEIRFEGCRIEQRSTTSSGTNESLYISSIYRSSFRNCSIVHNGTRQAADISSMSHSKFESCYFENDSETYPTVEIAGASDYSTFENCFFYQKSSTSTGVNPCFELVGPLHRSKILGCRFLSSSYYAFKASAGLDDSSIEDCFFSSHRTVFDLGEYITDNLVSIKNCEMKNTGGAWYNERFIRIRSYVADEYITGTNRPSSGVLIENLHLEDEWCLGHDSASSPPTTTGGTGGFPVVDLVGVSGSNLSFDREDLDYNVENGAWLSMENCRIDNVAVHVDGTAPMTPHTYTAGTVSNGIIEVKGPSAIRGLRYGSSLSGEVSRSVVWVQSVANMEVTTDGVSISVDTDPSRQAIVEGVQVSFDDGDAAFDGASNHGVALTLGGNARVSGFVWNADCKVDEREVAGAVPKTDSIVCLEGSYNILERAYIRHDCSTQGSVQYLITIGGLGYGNVVRNCTIKSKFHTPADDGSTQFPARIIDMQAGYSALIEGCDMFIEGTPTYNFFGFIASIATNNWRAVGNSCVIDGDLGAPLTDAKMIYDGDSLLFPNSAAVGNTVAATQGSTIPTIDVGAEAGNRTNVDTTTSRYPSL